MTLMDAAATAFALRSSSSSGSGASGVLQQQQQQRQQVGGKPSAATRLGSIDPAPPARSRSGSKEERPTTQALLPARSPLFSFGAIADVQYADQDDGWNFKKDYRRYYRGGLTKLKDAVDMWLRDETHRFVLIFPFVFLSFCGCCFCLGGRGKWADVG